MSVIRFGGLLFGLKPKELFLNPCTFCIVLHFYPHTPNMVTVHRVKPELFPFSSEFGGSALCLLLGITQLKFSAVKNRLSRGSDPKLRFTNAYHGIHGEN